MTADIRSLVKGCSKCEEFRLKPREPLVCSSWPGRPWWRLAVDPCTKDGRTSLVVVDYYSRYITVNELNDSSNTKTIVSKLETLFCLLGIPNTLVSDNGPQFVSDRFQSFLSKWDVKHITSSPKYPQSNGEAEGAVQTVKGLMKKNVNIQAALCAYRNTPLANGYSPAELMFGRSLNFMGVMPNESVNLSRLRQFEASQRKAQALYYNRRHGAREKEPVEVGQAININDGSQLKDGVIIATKGREIVSSNDLGVLLRRNRSQISKAADITSEDSTVSERQSLEEPNTCQPFEVSLQIWPVQKL